MTICDIEIRGAGFIQAMCVWAWMNNMEFNTQQAMVFSAMWRDVLEN